MCTGGSAKKDAKKQRQVQQEQQVVQQQQFEQQMGVQRQQAAVQEAQYEEQFEIANAAPPPAPNPVAEAAAMATDLDSGAMARMGSGRRAMRSDLSIPAVQGGQEAAAAVKQGTAKYEGAPRRSKARANAELQITETGGAGAPRELAVVSKPVSRDSGTKAKPTKKSGGSTKYLGSAGKRGRAPARPGLNIPSSLRS